MLSTGKSVSSWRGPHRARIEGENEAELIREIELYQGTIGHADIVLRLRAALAEDEELYELIRSRAGDKGYRRLLSTVMGFIPETS